jgi:HEAT repeat protein
VTRDLNRQAQLSRAAASRWATRRYGAAQRLSAEDPAFAVPLLKRLLTEGPTIRVTAAAAASLRALGDARGQAVLREALDHPHDWVRLLAAEALAPEEQVRAWPVLEAALDSDDVDMYGHAMDGLWRFGGERPLELTERIARERDREPFLREMAVRTLGWHGTRGSVSAIRAALSDSERYVREAAKQAIARIEAREPVDE